MSRQDTGLIPLEVADWEAQFLLLLEQGDLAHPRATIPPATRGKYKQTPRCNLADRLQKYQKAFLGFLEDFRVDFDNKLAERDLSMIKVQQKVSSCFRSLTGAQDFRPHSWLFVHIAQARSSSLGGFASDPLRSSCPSFQCA